MAGFSLHLHIILLYGEKHRNTVGVPLSFVFPYPLWNTTDTCPWVLSVSYKDRRYWYSCSKNKIEHEMKVETFYLVYSDILTDSFQQDIIKRGGSLSIISKSGLPLRATILCWLSIISPHKKNWRYELTKRLSTHIYFLLAPSPSPPFHSPALQTQDIFDYLHKGMP